MEQAISLIPIDQIKIQKFNVRKKDIQTGIEDLWKKPNLKRLITHITNRFSRQNVAFVLSRSDTTFDNYRFSNSKTR